VPVLKKLELSMRPNLILSIAQSSGHMQMLKSHWGFIMLSVCPPVEVDAMKQIHYSHPFTNNRIVQMEMKLLTQKSEHCRF